MFIEPAFFTEFEYLINRYMVFLVHVQKSTRLQTIEKAEIFGTAHDIAEEIMVNVASAMNNLNEYNREEKKKDIKEALTGIGKKIINHIKANHRAVIIRDDQLFILSNITIELTGPNNDVRLTRNDVYNFYSFNKLNNGHKPEIVGPKGPKIIEGPEAPGKEQGSELEELKQKAFLEFLRNPKNEKPIRYWKVNKLVIEKAEKAAPQFSPTGDVDEKKAGLFFIAPNKDDLVIQYMADACFVRYTVTMTGEAEVFYIKIAGEITVNGKKDAFKIDEKYPISWQNKAITTFGLAKIIEIFNRLIAEHFSEDDDQSDIDDFLDGKID